MTEIDTGMRGTLILRKLRTSFDAFESRTSGYIEPVAALPGNSVAQVLPANSFLASISYWLLNLLQEVWEAVVNFFQPGSALASEVQVEADSVMSMVMLEESIPTGQVWKTYYYAGSQRVAMRVDDGETNEVYYLFTDHLGSTSITTDSEGNLYGEMRYTAWGTVRYANGGMLTDYTYTGQRSEVDSFGLMYYNARWYDSALGRFAQADSIIPEPGNPLGWDRFGYAINNPIHYNDPSGHVPCFEDGYCPQNGSSEEDLIAGWARYYKIKITGAWAFRDKWGILNGVIAIGSAFANVMGAGNPNIAFYRVFGSLTFNLKSGAKDGSWSCGASGSGFSCDPDSRGKIDARLVAHELGHTFNAIIANNKKTTPYANLWRASIRDDFGNWVTGIKDGVWERGYVGYKSKGAPDLYHGPDDWDDPATGSVNEEFADMFMNWVFNSFDYRSEANGAGTARYNWMTTNMTEWIDRAGR